MAAIVDKLMAREQGPWGAGQVITWEVPAVGFADLTRSRLEWDFTPAPTPADPAGVVACTLPAGAAGIVKSIAVTTLTGMPLERVEDYNILAHCVQAAGYGQDVSSYRQLAYGEMRNSLFDLLNRSTTAGTASTYRTKKMFLDLSTLLGVFKWESWPLEATGGLRIQVTLAAAENCMKRFTVGGEVIECDDAAGGAVTITTKAIEPANGATMNRIVYPMIDQGRAATEPHFRVGDNVVFGFTDNTGAIVADVRALTSADYTSDGRMTLGFTGQLSADPITVVSVFRSPSAAAVTFLAGGGGTGAFPAFTTIADSPWFVGQEVTAVVQTGGAGDYADVASRVASVTLAANATVLTFNPALGNNQVGFLRGTPATSMGYQITNARFRLRKITPPPAALEAMKKGIEMDIVTLTTSSFQVASGSLRIDWQIPTPSYMGRALAIITVPTITAGAARFDLRTRGTRSFITSYQYWVDGQSDPLQPISLTAPNPPINDAAYLRTMQHLSAGTDGAFPSLKVLEAGRTNFFMPKPLGAAGTTSNIANKNVRLEANASAGLPAMQMNTFVFHIRRLVIGANSVQLV